MSDLKLGMPEKDIVSGFRKMCEESVNPDLYSSLVDKIIPALKLARKRLAQEAECICKGEGMVWWDKADKEIISSVDACQMPDGAAEVIPCPKCNKKKVKIDNVLMTPIAFHPDDCCGCTNFYLSPVEYELVAECNECGMKRQFLLSGEGGIFGSTVPFKVAPE